MTHKESRERIRAIVSQYESGRSAEDIAQSYNITYSYVTTILRIWGLPLKKKTRGMLLKEERNKKIIEQRESGMSFRAIGRLHGITGQMVAKIIKRHETDKGD